MARNNPIEADTLPFTNEAIDSTAQLISYNVPNEVIREGLKSRGLSDYSSYLCYKAAQLLLASGFYETYGSVVVAPRR